MDPLELRTCSKDFSNSEFTLRKLTYGWMGQGIGMEAAKRGWEKRLWVGMRGGTAKTNGLLREWMEIKYSRRFLKYVSKTVIKMEIIQKKIGKIVVQVGISHHQWNFQFWNLVTSNQVFYPKGPVGSTKWSRLFQDYWFFSTNCGANQPICGGFT